MLKKPAPQQTALEIVTLDCLVPKDHLLRKTDAATDFSFIMIVLHPKISWGDLEVACPSRGSCVRTDTNIVSEKWLQ